MTRVRVAAANEDNWDQHWTEFSGAAEVGPTPRYRRRLISSLLQIPHTGDGVRFLEVGSGTAEFAEEFCDLFPKAAYLGVELSETGVNISRKRVPRAQFLQRDLLKPPSSTVLLDYGATNALCSEVLEHVDDPKLLLRNAAAYCAPGCRLIVTVPGGPMNAFYRHIGHRRHYSPAELKQLLEAAGFAVEQSFGAGFPFFNLFRLLLTMRGSKFVSDVSGPPSISVRLASRIFDLLFKLNLRSFGWQTLAVARYRP